jgi:hypothetical protein
MKKILSLISIVLTSFIALPAFADITTFKDLINVTIIGGMLRPLVPLIIGLAVVVFVYGVLTTMLSEGGEKKEEGKQYMLWGIIGIFVMVSLWGIVNIIGNTFQLDNRAIPTVIK